MTAPMKSGKAEIYVFVLEARDIHTFSFCNQAPGTKVGRIDEVQVAYRIWKKDPAQRLSILGSSQGALY